MEHSYEITFTCKDGKVDKMTFTDEEAAKHEIFRRIKEDPSCTASVVIAEFEKETPNKRWVKMERYENRSGHIERIDY